MTHPKFLLLASATFIATTGLSASAFAGTTVQIGNSGKTFASSAAQCTINPATGVNSPKVHAGLFNPSPLAEADVLLNGVKINHVQAAVPVADVWLAVGSNAVSVVLSKKVADTYVFSVTSGQCNVPATSGNYFSTDGTLEYAASGKSYMTVTPGCALNGATGLAPPIVNLFDDGS